MFNVGIIGLGWGSQHLKVIQNLEGMEVIGAIEPDEEKAKKAGVKIFSNISQLVEASPDMIVVASPTRHHESHVLQLMQADVPMLVEKPVCLTSEEADVIDTYQTPEQRIGVGYLMRFSPVVEDALLFMQENGLMPVQYKFSWIKDAGQHSDRYDLIRDEATHPLDLVIHELYPSQNKKRIEIRSNSGFVQHPDGDITGAITRLLIDDRIELNGEVSYHTATHKRHVSLYCENGENRWCIHILFDSGSNGTDKAAAIRMGGDDGWHKLVKGKAVKANPGIYASTEVNRLEEQLLAMQRWIVEGTQDSRICTLEEALTNVKIGNTLYDTCIDNLRKVN